MKIPFRPFDNHSKLRIYHHGLLPHWRQDGCTYFVTFRQADSLPKSVMQNLEEERKLWLTSHGIDPDSDNWKTAFAALKEPTRRDYLRRIETKVNIALDAGHGSCVLRNSLPSKIVADGLTCFHGTRLWMGDFVVMPNHVHGLMTPRPGYQLEGVIRSIKGFTSYRINHLLGLKGVFWQREVFDHAVRDFEHLERFQRYIANNPTKARLREGHYTHARARYHQEKSGGGF